MSDRMRPIPFAGLMDWALREQAANGSVFGVDKLYRHEGGTLELFQEKLETPFGPAAGPHTQLAQNIIAAYAAGARFFELKTVQILDGEDLPVSKPCITAADECYNCEWSTELRVEEAFEEYVKAWFAIKLLSRALGLGAPDGFVFNMSVGYDLEGIQSPKIDRFIEGLKNAADTPVWRACRVWADENLSRLNGLTADDVDAISPRVCDSITLSTLHGCPPREIERIAAYLIGEKSLNTFIKCNPTLLGYEFARSTVDALGFDYLTFDDFHFRDDLQYADAVPMLRRLQAQADRKGVAFGVKLTNTFPVAVADGELPSEEMYMSGRSLFPLTVALAQKLCREFEGKLRVSFSGGADAFNIARLFEAGIWPVTLATTLLKPGGYNRLRQMAERLAGCEYKPFTGVDLQKLDALAGEAMTSPRYRKAVKPAPPRKLDKKVPLIDCFTAPCRGGCPIEQDIPAYLRLAGEGKYGEALAVITERNPLPFITGTICSHRCMDKCTRSFYEEPVDIRAVKLECAQKAFGPMMKGLSAPPKSGGKIAVVGGGAAGMACAFFLARAGRDVTILEREERLGGIVRRVIPAFRVDDAAIENDAALVRAMGVRVETGRTVTSLDDLRAEGFERVVLAVGAEQPGSLELESGEAMNVLDFLARLKAEPETLTLGGNVAVIGGGNTAMDAARAALRAPGVERVSLVYRRSRRYMPADEEELALAVADGVRFCELLAPIGLRDGVLTCRRMTLGAPDASGRRSPAPTDELAAVPADTLIAAVGERVDSRFYAALGLALDQRGRPVVDGNLQSSLPGVYVAGDGRRGPATVVEAIADAAKIAGAIAGAVFARHADKNAAGDAAAARQKKGLLCADTAARAQTERCLDCATLCGCCADVCPNRANLLIGGQILHVDGMCNECGNCATFCPYDSAPYKDKFTLFWSEDDLADSQNEGFLPLGGLRVKARLDGRVEEIDLAAGDAAMPAALAALMRTVCRAQETILL